MSTPAIGGKVLDASAVAAVARGRLTALAWLTVSRRIGIVLFLPAMAIGEVRALRPDSGPVLDELIAHPWVVLDVLDVLDDDASHDRAGVEQVLERASAADTSAVGLEVVDVLAAHVVHATSSRGWPVLTTDPVRLYRPEPTVEVELL